MLVQLLKNAYIFACLAFVLLIGPDIHPLTSHSYAESKDLQSSNSDIVLRPAYYVISPQSNQSGAFENNGDNCEHVFVKTVFSENQNVSEVIGGWNQVRSSGTLFLFAHDISGNLKREIFSFSSTNLQCNGNDIQISGNITGTSLDTPSRVDVTVNGSAFRLYINNEKLGHLSLNLSQLRTWPPNSEYNIQSLAEGQREGPLLLEKINHDNVTGLNYITYPLARLAGIPVTLHIGDIIGNGCNKMIRLLNITSQETAIFVVNTQPQRICPI